MKMSVELKKFLACFLEIDKISACSAAYGALEISLHFIYTTAYAKKISKLFRFCFSCAKGVAYYISSPGRDPRMGPHVYQSQK